MKSIWFAYAMMWVAVSVAVSIGLYFTRNIHCLWFMIIPSLVSVKQDSKDKDKASTEANTSKEGREET